MYLKAAINAVHFPSTQIHISSGQAEIQIETNDSYHHAMHATHGAVYFKLLDDAAFFAAQSLEPSYFILTKTYQVSLKRPIHNEKIRCVGEIITENDNEIQARATLYLDSGKIAATGEGVFVKSGMELSSTPSYCSPHG